MWLYILLAVIPTSQAQTYIECKVGDFKPDSSNCSVFYHCDASSKWAWKTCAINTVFDVKVNVCVSTTAKTICPISPTISSDSSKVTTSSIPCSTCSGKDGIQTDIQTNMSAHEFDASTSNRDNETVVSTILLSSNDTGSESTTTTSSTSDTGSTWLTSLLPIQHIASATDNTLTNTTGSDILTTTDPSEQNTSTTNSEPITNGGYVILNNTFTSTTKYSTTAVSRVISPINMTINSSTWANKNAPTNILNISDFLTNTPRNDYNTTSTDGTTTTTRTGVSTLTYTSQFKHNGSIIDKAPIARSTSAILVNTSLSEPSTSANAASEMLTSALPNEYSASYVKSTFTTNRVLTILSGAHITFTLDLTATSNTDLNISTTSPTSATRNASDYVTVLPCEHLNWAAKCTSGTRSGNRLDFPKEHNVSPSEVFSTSSLPRHSNVSSVESTSNTSTGYNIPFITSPRQLAFPDARFKFAIPLSNFQPVGKSCSCHIILVSTHLENRVRVRVQEIYASSFVSSDKIIEVSRNSSCALTYRINSSDAVNVGGKYIRVIYVTAEEVIHVILNLISHDMTHLAFISFLSTSLAANKFIIVSRPPRVNIEVFTAYAMFTALEGSAKIQLTFPIARIPPIKFTLNGLDIIDARKMETVLESFQTLLLESKGDLTGTFVESSKPVLLISGLEQVSDISGRASSAEHAIPVAMTSTTYITFPSVDLMSLDTYRTVALFDNTVIEVPELWYKNSTTGKTILSLAGDTVEFSLPPDGFYLLRADKPILSVKCSEFGNATGSNTTVTGSSCVNLLPETFWASSYSWNFPSLLENSTDFRVYLFVVMATDVTAYFHLNGLKPAAMTWAKVLTGGTITNMSGGYLLIKPGFYWANVQQSDTRFAAYLLASGQNVRLCTFLGGTEILDMNFVNPEWSIKGRQEIKYGFDILAPVTLSTSDPLLASSTHTPDSTQVSQMTTWLNVSTSNNVHLATTEALPASSSHAELFPDSSEAPQLTTWFNVNTPVNVQTSTVYGDLICIGHLEPVKLSEWEFEELIKAIKQYLFIDPKSTSNHRRKMGSASDDRPFSRGIGGTGIACIVCVFASIVIVDIVKLITLVKPKVYVLESSC